MRLILETCFLSIFAIAIRGTLPRYRLDQAIIIYWKVVSFLLIIFILDAQIASFLTTL